MPSVATFGTFATIVALIVVAPGPSLFLLLRNTPVHGRAAGIANTSGICTAIITHALLSVIGVSAIIASSAMLFALLKISGAAYLIWLGGKSLVSAWRGEVIAKPDKFQVGNFISRPKQTANISRRFAEGWLTNLLNPKPALFYLAAFPQFVVPDGTPVVLQGLVLGGLHAVIAFGWYGTLVLGIHNVNAWLRHTKVWRSVQTVTGLALIALGGRLLATRAAS